MFGDSRGMSEAVAHANQITNRFDVEIISINTISANPVDYQLTASLASGTVASAEALQAETAACDRAKAMKIETEGYSEAMATLIKARAEGEAETLRAEGVKAADIIRAEGCKKAAELLESSKDAETFETLRASASAIKGSDTFFF
jgi:regulator of protease activity HflC (stomatin/prohibitin superfamily)